MKSGVYKIEHVDSGKVYIGSAGNLSKRISDHKYGLRNNRHPNPLLQRAFNKYGETSFTFTPLIICRKENLLFYEQRAMDVYKSYDRKLGFNIRTQAASNIGIPTSQAQKEAIRKVFQRPEYRKKRRCPEPGEKYGRLTLVELKEKTPGSYTWLCRCDCGKEVLKKVHCLRRGDTRSCGCYNKEVASKLRKGKTYEYIDRKLVMFNGELMARKAVEKIMGLRHRAIAIRAYRHKQTYQQATDHFARKMKAA